MSIERYLRIVRETSQTKQVIKESKTPVVKEEAKVENPYRSTEQVLGIVQRMMEDARVPQKPRQGPLRPQTGAGKHKDKKKDQKQGKAKHKGKELDEGRYSRYRDDQFSLGGRMPRTDRIDRDSSSGQDAQQRMERKLKQQTIDRLLDKGFKVDALNGKSLPELIQMLRESASRCPQCGSTKCTCPRGKCKCKPVEGWTPKSVSEAVKKPNATTRHLRDYPVSDKDVAKPVKKPEKKKPEKGVAEGSNKNVVKSIKVGNFRHDLVDTGMGWQVRIYNGDELYDTGMSKNSEQKGLAALEDAVAYTEKQTRTKRQGVAEEKQKGVDGKACWKGYKRMGTKKKGGRTVDNCVKMESISEGILSSFGLMEKSPPGFKGTVKAMKKHPELTKGKTKDGKEKNPWALAWHMKNKGYKSHKKADGSDKD